MAQFRKKPVVIEAIKWEGLPDLNEMLGSEKASEIGRMEAFDDWLVANQGDRKCTYHGDTILIPTLEGIMIASRGDWIIRGVKGELYPIKDEIFRETYEEVAGA